MVLDASSLNALPQTLLQIMQGGHKSTVCHKLKTMVKACREGRPDRRSGDRSFNKSRIAPAHAMTWALKHVSSRDGVSADLRDDGSADFGFAGSCRGGFMDHADGMMEGTDL